MKQVIKSGFKPPNAREVKALTVETKETAISKNQLKKFSVVDLWAIQKYRRAASARFRSAC